MRFTLCSRFVRYCTRFVRCCTSFVRYCTYGIVQDSLFKTFVMNFPSAPSDGFKYTGLENYVKNIYYKIIIWKKKLTIQDIKIRKEGRGVQMAAKIVNRTFGTVPNISKQCYFKGICNVAIPKLKHVLILRNV